MASWIWTALSDELVEVFFFSFFFFSFCTTTWIWVLSVLMTLYLTLGKLLRFFEAQFSHSKNGNNIPYALGPLWKYLIWCLAHKTLFSFSNVIKRIVEICFFSRNIISLKFIVMVLCSSTSLVFTTVWFNYSFSCQRAFGLLEDFSNFVILKSAAMNILVHVSWCRYCSVFHATNGYLRFDHALQWNPESVPIDSNTCLMFSQTQPLLVTMRVKSLCWSLLNPFLWVLQRSCSQSLVCAQPTTLLCLGLNCLF